RRRQRSPERRLPRVRSGVEPPSQMRHLVSVVICTLNRADSLRETLRCLRHQRYASFEVIVVNGPSTDHTDTVLAEFAGVIRAEMCPVPNLSVSRNIGIRAAAGDIVAFI